MLIIAGSNLCHAQTDKNIPKKTHTQKTIDNLYFLSNKKKKGNWQHWNLFVGFTSRNRNCTTLISRRSSSLAANRSQNIPWKSILLGISMAHRRIHNRLTEADLNVSKAG